MDRSKWRRSLEIIVVMASHWRRKPLQLLTLFTGLAVATALFAGVQALNAEARASYDEAARLLGGNRYPMAVRRDGALFDESLFTILRREGWLASPVLRSDQRFGSERVAVIGMDLVTAPQFSTPLEATEFSDNGVAHDITDFLAGDGFGVANPRTIERLRSNDYVPASFPRLVANEKAPEGVIFLDIAAAQRFLDAPGKVSGLIFEPTRRRDAAGLAARLGEEFALNAPQQHSDVERLTESFHLNLTAFGYLSYLVGLLIAHAAAALAFEQRRAMFRTMRACGVSARSIIRLLTIEICVIALAAGLVGVLVGYTIAAALLPDVAATLEGLYGARLSGGLSFRPAWWGLAMAMSLSGALLASANILWRAGRLPILAVAAPQAWANAQRRDFRRQQLAACTLLAVSILLLVFGEGLRAGFLLLAFVLLGAAFALPSVVGVFLDAVARGPLAKRSAVSQWFWSDARMQLSGLSIALQALLLALAVNIGVSAMVSSFRVTFDGWLDQRLAAEIYVNPLSPEKTAEIRRWLAAQDGVDRLLPTAMARTRYVDRPVSLIGVVNDETYVENWPLLEGAADPWARLALGEGVFINEQLARGEDVSVGAILTLETQDGPWPVNVLGIYSDYGNTRYEFMMNFDVLTARWPDANRSLTAVRADPQRADGLAAALQEKFSLSSQELIDQAGLKAYSKSIFEQTFAVTSALNVLTMIVAGIALFASFLSLSSARVPQLAPLWALGVTRRRLGLSEVLKALALAFGVALCAIPLGLAVAWILTSVINVEAFGWKLPVIVFPGQIFALLALACVTAVVAAAPPAVRLSRTAPALLVKVFADER